MRTHLVQSVREQRFPRLYDFDGAPSIFSLRRRCESPGSGSACTVLRLRLARDPRFEHTRATGPAAPRPRVTDDAHGRSTDGRVDARVPDAGRNTRRRRHPDKTPHWPLHLTSPHLLPRRKHPTAQPLFTSSLLRPVLLPCVCSTSWEPGCPLSDRVRKPRQLEDLWPERSRRTTGEVRAAACLHLIP